MSADEHAARDKDISADARHDSAQRAAKPIHHDFWVMDDRDTPTSQLGHVWTAAPRFVLVEKTVPARPTANDMGAPRYRAGYRADFGRDIPLKHFNGLDTATRHSRPTSGRSARASSRPGSAPPTSR